MFLLIMLQNIWKYISYWYFRYLMVTELYMVERWERHTINGIALILFGLLWYFNIYYVVSLTSTALSYATPFTHHLGLTQS